MRAANKSFPYGVIVDRTVVRPADEVLTFMQGKNFEPDRLVVFDAESIGLKESEGGAGELKADLSVLRYEAEEIVIRVRTNRASYLVLSEIFYPGWRAEANGRRIPIYRGNYVFRVLPLQQGERKSDSSLFHGPFGSA